MNIEELEAAINSDAKDIDAVFAMRKASHTLLNLLRAIEDKRLAIVPMYISENDKAFNKGRETLYKSITGGSSYGVSFDMAYHDAISAVDQQEILKELDNDKNT